MLATISVLMCAAGIAFSETVSNMPKPAVAETEYAAAMTAWHHAESLSEQTDRVASDEAKYAAGKKAVLEALSNAELHFNAMRNVLDTAPPERVAAITWDAATFFKQFRNYQAARQYADLSLKALDETSDKTGKRRAFIGSLFERAGDTGKAIALYHRAVSDGFDRARLYLAIAYYRQGHFPDALDAIRPYLAAHPDTEPLAHYTFGFILEHARRLEDARTAYQKTQTIFAKHPCPELTPVDVSAATDRIHAKLTEELADTRNLREQRRIMFIAKLGDIPQTEIDAHLKEFDAQSDEWIRQRALIQTGKRIQALAVFDGAMQQYDNTGNTSDERTGAVNQFNNVIKLDTRFASAYLFRGKALLVEGAVDEAVDSLLEARRLDGDNPLIHYYLGRAFLDTKDTAKAAAALTKSVQLDPEFAPAKLYLAIATVKAASLSKWEADWSYVDVENKFSALLGECVQANKAIKRASMDFTAASAMMMLPDDSNYHAIFQKSVNALKKRIRVRMQRLNKHAANPPAPGVRELP